MKSNRNLTATAIVACLMLISLAACKNYIPIYDNPYDPESPVYAAVTPPTIIGPAEDSEFDTGFTIRWKKAGTLADSYRLQLAAENDFRAGSVVLDTEFQGVDNYKLTSIPYNGAVFCRLALKLDRGGVAWSPWSAVLRLVKSPPAGNHAPTVSLTPPAAASVKGGAAVIFTATGADADGDVLLYKWYVDGTEQNVRTASFTFDTPILAVDKTYTIAVAVCDGGTASAPASVNLVVYSPTVFELTPTPADGGTTSDTTPLLDWNDVAGAAGYELQIAESSGAVASTTAVAITTSQYQYPATLAFGDTRYWRARAKNMDNVWESWSSIWNFTLVAPLLSMIPVAGGTFQMGSSFGNSNELPLHSVTLTSFRISKYEVIQAQYAVVTGSSPSYFTGDANRPVEQVGWYDAVEFCNKLSTREGLNSVYSITSRLPSNDYPITSATVTMDRTKNGYRLPTEAEWEYAARGGASSSGYIYSGSNTASDVAWYNGNAGDTTHLVGTKAANELGIYDMSGNVLEWCWDWYGTYPGAAQTDPTGVSSGTGCVLRGGSWYGPADYIRSANRSDTRPYYRSNYFGFRVLAPSRSEDTNWTYNLTPTLADAAITSDTTPLLNWNDVADAVGYQIQIANTSAEIGSATTIAISQSQYQYPAIKNLGETRYWRVRAIKDDTVLGPWSATWSFSIIAPLLTFVSVPGGSFQMGSSSGELDELPIHSVTLTSFRIGKYEVTQAQYATAMGNNPSYFSGDTTKPVEQVTWYDAIEFCNKLSTLEGLDSVYAIINRSPVSGYPVTSATVTMDRGKNGYRLPTEAEWEYSARGGLSSAEYAYSGSNNAGTVAWYSSNTTNMTQPVGTKAANELGIHDMSGNVWEWCWDWLAAYPSAAQTDPTGASSGSYRVKRGGSWDNSAESIRSAVRSYDDSGFRYGGIGFRVLAPF